MPSPLDDKARAHLRATEVTSPQMKVISFLAERGGEIPWDWSKVSAQAKAMLADLINKELVIDREYIADARAAVGRLVLRLTDRGRQIADLLERLSIRKGDSPSDQVSTATATKD